MNDSAGNRVATGSASDDPDALTGSAEVVLTFAGSPGVTYTANGGHFAIPLFMEAAIDPPQAGPTNYLSDDIYNFEGVSASPIPVADYYDWFGPGPDTSTKQKVIKTGNTSAKAIRYYTLNELSGLVTDAQSFFPTGCDAAFKRVLSPYMTYTKNAFFSSLFATTYLQYPPGVAQPADMQDADDDADTEINVNGRPIRLFANFYPTKYGFPANFQSSILIHEGLHHFTGWTDTTLTSRFNLTPTQTGGTGYVSEWILGGCS